MAVTAPPRGAERVGFIHLTSSVSEVPGAAYASSKCDVRQTSATPSKETAPESALGDRSAGDGGRPRWQGRVPAVAAARRMARRPGVGRDTVQHVTGMEPQPWGVGPVF